MKGVILPWNEVGVVGSYWSLCGNMWAIACYCSVVCKYSSLEGDGAKFYKLYYISHDDNDDQQ